MQYTPLREKHSQPSVRDVERPDMSCRAVQLEQRGQGGQKYSM